MLPLMTIRVITARQTNSALPATLQFSVVSQTHRVNTTNTIKCNLQLGEPLSIRTVMVLTRVLQRVSQRTCESMTLKLARIRRLIADALPFDIHATRAFRLFANLNPRR